MCPNISDVSSLWMLQSAAEMATNSFLTSIGVESIRRRVMGKKRGRKPYVTKHSSELLQYVAVFWRSYACLTLTNATLRVHFSLGDVFEDCRILFNLALGYFTKTHSKFLSKMMRWFDQFFLLGTELKILEDSESCNHILSRLVESLLTFLLVTTPSDSGNIRIP